MAYDVIIGRDKYDKERFGNKGLIFLGKGYVKMGQHTSLSNKIWMDVARSHVILVAGKRGSGKSYSLGVIAEELTNLPKEEAKQIAPIIFDTMGIFWTMKFENEKDKRLLDSWGLKTKKLPVRVFIPFGKEGEYKSKGIPYDNTLAIMASELEAEDWLVLFNLNFTSLTGVLIERVITKLKETHINYSLDDVQDAIAEDGKAEKDTKNIVSALYSAANTWGVFSKTNEGTEIKDLVNGGSTSVIDISVYSSVGAFNIRALIISLITRKLFKTRLDARKKEELEALQHSQDYLSSNIERVDPLVWLFIDEAHEFLKRDEKTPATEALIQVLREGRQPGISLVLATQQPGKIHSDVLTQSDIVISHRLTSKQDLSALNEIMQTYVLEGIRKQIDDLPSLKGAGIILDDNSERIYPVQVRPKFTWHGGEAPSIVKAEVEL